MMATVKEIFDFLNDFAPVERKMDFDNVGFLVGRQSREVHKIAVALDITDDVIKEAASKGTELLVSHHPLFFSLKTVTDDDVTGRKIVYIIENGMSAICMHTNLDAADGGVNDALAARLGLKDRELIVSEGVDSKGIAYCCGRMGTVEPTPMADFLKFAKEALKSNGLRYYDSGRKVNRIAVVGGSGGSYLDEAFKKDCDTLLTADVKYDVFLKAKDLNMNIIDADHFCTENTVVPVLQSILKKKFPELDVYISETHDQTAQFI